MTSLMLSELGEREGGEIFKFSSQNVDYTYIFEYLFLDLILEYKDIPSLPSKSKRLIKVDIENIFFNLISSDYQQIYDHNNCNYRQRICLANQFVKRLM